MKEDKVFDLISASFVATASKKKKEKVRPPKEWIVPANPKFYDIVHAFDNRDTIDWKQSSSVKAGDTIFMYVAAPVSAILYKCRAVEVDIPCEYADKDLTINTVMKIRLLRRYEPERFTFDRLKRSMGFMRSGGQGECPTV